MKFALRALLIAGVMMMPAHAQVTYSYSGNPFTAILDSSRTYKFSGFVAATLNVSEPIPQVPNTTINVSALPGFSLTMTDGSQVLTTSSAQADAIFSFDSDGDVTGWFVSVGGWAGVSSRSDDVFKLDQGVRVKKECLTMAQSRKPSSWEGFHAGR
jgi:hypothetical protein